MSTLLSQLQRIVAHAYEHAPTFREKMDKAGIKPADIRSLADLPRLPITKKDEVVALQKERPPFGGLLAVPLEEVTHIFVSPGPIYEPVGKERASAAFAEGLTAAGIGKGDVVLNTFSYHLVPAGLMVDEALCNMGATVLPTGVGNTDLQVKVMMDLKANAYVGTPSFLMTLLKRAEEMGIPRQALPMRKALFSAEPLPPSLRQSFEQDYGIRTTNAYATAELGLLGYDCEARSGWHVPTGIIIEITDPATGEPLGPGQVGEVTVTAFDFTFPLIRYAVGDLSAWAVGDCPCGRTSPRLVGWLGRVGDAVKVRGMFVHPSQLAEAMKQVPQVAAYQAVVTRPAHRDELTLRVELAAEVPDLAAVQETIGKAVQALCRVSVDKVEFVARGAIPPEAKKIVDERKWE